MKKTMFIDGNAKVGEARPFEIRPTLKFSGLEEGSTIISPWNTEVMIVDIFGDYIGIMATDCKRSFYRSEFEIIFGGWKKKEIK